MDTDKLNKTQDWLKFEHLTCNMMIVLAPNAIIEHNVKLLGKSSQRRQVDVLATIDTGEHKNIHIAFDCKLYNKPVNITVVDGFIGKLLDLGFDSGVLVSKSGFSKSAIERAKIGNVILYDLYNSDYSQLSSKLAVGQHIILRRILNLQFELGYEKEIVKKHLEEHGDFVEIYDEKHMPSGNLNNLIMQSFTVGPFKEIEEGNHDRELINKIFLKVDNNFIETCLKLKFTCLIEHYIGRLPLATFSGFFNRNIKRFHFKGLLQSEPIVFNRDIKDWERIQSEEERNLRLPCLFTTKVITKGDVPIKIIYKKESIESPIIAEWSCE